MGEARRREAFSLFRWQFQIEYYAEISTYTPKDNHEPELKGKAYIAHLNICILETKIQTFIREESTLTTNQSYLT